MFYYISHTGGKKKKFWLTIIFKWPVKAAVTDEALKNWPLNILSFE